MSSGLLFGILAIMAIVSVQVGAQKACVVSTDCPANHKCCTSPAGSSSSMICVYNSFICKDIQDYKTDCTTNPDNCKDIKGSLGYTCCAIAQGSAMKACAKSMTCPTGP